MLSLVQLFSCSLFLSKVWSIPSSSPLGESSKPKTHGQGTTKKPIQNQVSRTQGTASSTGLPGGVTVIATTSGGSTWSETLLGTSLSKYSTITRETTITTTDASGAVAVAVVFAGGLAWWFWPKAGVPQIEPPSAPPTLQPSISSLQSHSTKSTSTTKSSTSSTRSSVERQTPSIYYAPSNWRSLLSEKPIKIEDDARSCGFPNDDPATVNMDVAADQIKVFCEAKKEQPVLIGSPLYEMYNIGGGMVLNITVRQNSVCAEDKDQKLDWGDCDYFLQQTLDDCDRGQDEKHGGIVNDCCFTYILHPEDNEGEKNCSSTSDGTGVNREAALKNIADFCSKNSGSTISPNQGNTLQYKQDLGDSQAAISVRYSDSCQRGSGAGYTIQERACNRFLTRAIDDCNTDFHGPYGKYGGEVTDHCGIFKFETQVVETLSCSLGNGDDYQPPHNINTEDGQRAIEDWCNKDLSVDPNLTSAGTFSQYPRDGESYDNFLDGLDNYVIRMKADFLADQPECEPKEKFSTKGDECKRKMKKLLDTCNGKQGGGLVDSTPHGCVGWIMYGQGTS